MFGIGPPEMLILLVIGVLLFGKNLPTVGRQLGKSMMEFKKGLNDIKNEVNAATYMEPEPSREFLKLMGWADSMRRLGVYANADTPRDAETARRFGAQGIGLCRTEHMFFEGDRIDAVREMILAESPAKRSIAAKKAAAIAAVASSVA